MGLLFLYLSLCFIQFVPQRTCSVQCTPDYTCADYPVGLSVHDRKVPVTSDEGGATHQCRPGLLVLRDYGSYFLYFLGLFFERRICPSQSLL